MSSLRADPNPIEPESTTVRTKLPYNTFAVHVGGNLWSVSGPDSRPILSDPVPSEWATAIAALLNGFVLRDGASRT